MHANRAREIANQFDRVSYLSSQLENEKSTVIGRILRAAAYGGFYLMYNVETKGVEGGVHKYLEVDCGYRVERGSDGDGVYLEIYWD